jgi:hypothetical protein
MCTGLESHKGGLDSMMSSNRTEDDLDDRVYYYEYLAHDINHTAEIEFDTFVELVWNVKLGENCRQTERITGEERFKDLLEDYCHKVSHESDRYNPFTKFANHILDRTGHTTLVFVRNDPTYVWGSHAQRKPDVFSIFRTALNIGSCGDEDNLSEGGPGENDAFHWGEVITFEEFKLEKKEYEESQEALVPGECLLTMTATL